MTEPSNDQTAPDATKTQEKAGGSTVQKKKRGRPPLQKTSPKKRGRPRGRRRTQTDRSKSPNHSKKEKGIVLEEFLVQAEDTKTPVETTKSGSVRSGSRSSPSTCHVLCDGESCESEEEATQAPWMRDLIDKFSRKEYSSKRRNKKKTSTKSSSKTRSRSRSTVSMRKHHHATFAHLIHDAFLRLKCNPNYNHGGFSKRAVAKNIEKHYKVKLGTNFKARLKLSFENLVAKKKLIAHGKRRYGIKYTPAPAFLKQFERLKVIGGAALAAHAIRVRSSKSSSPSLSRSSSRSSRGSSRSSTRSSTRSSRGHKRRRRKKVRINYRTQHVCGSKHWRCEHIPTETQQSDDGGESSTNLTEFSEQGQEAWDESPRLPGPALRSPLGPSDSASSEQGSPEEGEKRGSWTSMFSWPKRKSQEEETPVESAPPEETLESNSNMFDAEENVPQASASTKDPRESKKRIRRYKKKIRITYPSRDPSPQSTPSQNSPRQSPGSSRRSSSSDQSRELSLDRDPVTDSRWKIVDEVTTSNEGEPFEGFTPGEDYQETLYTEDYPDGDSRQRKEHDLLHNIKSSSEMGSPKRKSWFAKLFGQDEGGSERTSTSQANQASRSGPLKRTTFGPEVSKGRVKKVMSKGHSVSPDAETISRNASRLRSSEVFCSPKLAILLQEWKKWYVLNILWNY